MIKVAVFILLWFCTKPIFGTYEDCLFQALSSADRLDCEIQKISGNKKNKNKKTDKNTKPHNYRLKNKKTIPNQ